MFGFFNRSKASQKVTIESMDDLRMLHTQNPDEFQKLIPEYAEEGNTICQKFLAQASLSLLSEESNPEKVAFLQARYFKFGTMVAERGDFEEQFNLGIQHMRQVNGENDILFREDINSDADINNIRLAALWIRRSADLGFAPALEIIDGIEALARRDHALDDKGEGHAAGKNEPTNTITSMGIEADILEITQSGKVIMKSGSVREMPRDHFEGKIFEITIIVEGEDPYFVYYLSLDYYLGVVQSSGSITKSLQYEEFRNSISQEAYLYLSRFLLNTKKKDISRKSVNFSHNRRHTNVLAFVESLSEWYPIRHNEGEPDNATEKKVALVNAGSADVRDFISISEASPS